MNNLLSYLNNHLSDLNNHLSYLDSSVLSGCVIVRIVFIWVKLQCKLWAES